MPSEVDRQRIDTALRELDDTQAKLDEPVAPVRGHKSLQPGSLRRRVLTSPNAPSVSVSTCLMSA